MKTEAGESLTLSRKLLDNVEWQDEALCREMNDRFMPARKPSNKELAELRQFCIKCPVLTECANDARMRGAYGFWAGVWHPVSHLKGQKVFRIRSYTNITRE